MNQNAEPSQKKSYPMRPGIKRPSSPSSHHTGHVLVIGNESLFDVGILFLLETLPGKTITHIKCQDHAAILRAVEAHQGGLVILVWDKWMDLDDILNDLMPDWMEVKIRLVVVSQEVSQIAIYEHRNPIEGIRARYIPLVKADDFLQAVQANE